MSTHRSTTAMLGAAVSLGVILAAGACSGDDDDEAGADGATATTSSEAEEATVFELGDGDCLASDPGVQGQVSEVPKVPCDEPHHSEVFHTYTIDAAELPPAAELEGLVQEQCLAEFETFVGVAYEQSALEVTWLEPTPESWERGDHELVCMITDPAGETTGSLEGANR